MIAVGSEEKHLIYSALFLVSTGTVVLIGTEDYAKDITFFFCPLVSDAVT